MSRRINRRDFVRSTSLAGAGFWIAGRQTGYGQDKSPNAKLNIACIGCGGQAASGMKSGSSKNIVALCDVDQRRLEAAAKLHPNAKKYDDFRKVFDDAKDFDAVVVAIPEHTHAFATLPALQLGKHVYCEKPLTHGVWEARVVTEASKKAKVATQMGTQAHASESGRRGGALGPGPMRRFHSISFPGPRWYRWWDFGSGTMSDLGSHMNDIPFWALKLDAPRTIEGFGPPPHPEIAPATC